MKWTRRPVQALAVLYPAALAGVALTLRYVGESWWVSTVGLYLPRVIFGLHLPLLAAALALQGMRRLLLVQVASLLLVLFPVMGLTLPWRVTDDPAAPSLRIASLNVNAGRGGVAAIVEAVVRYSPDVVLLQETAGNEDFLPPLRARFATVTASGQFILATRFPLVDTLEPEKLSYEGQPRSPRFVKYVLDTPLGRITFYSVHPISPREGLASLRKEGLGKEVGSGHLFEGSSAHVLEINTGLRTLQVETFARAAALEEGPVVIAGDTNLPDPSPVLRSNLREYEDAFLSAGWGFGYTFPTNKWRPWMRIDRILSNDALHCTSFELGRPVVSDHHLLIADLQRTSRSSPP